MGTEAEFHEVMLGLHQRTGRGTGYWPGRFLNAVRNHGGLAYAKQLLTPGRLTEGFEQLIAASRVDLSVEYIALSQRFRDLFTEEEVQEAQARLANVPSSAYPSAARSPFPDEVLSDGRESFPEGALTRVFVNQYERNPKARAACIRHRGLRCVVCDMSFEERYGEIGREFIHVHHVRPLSGPGAKRQVDPKTDLVPVCPNCHAMLHRTAPPMDVEHLRDVVTSA